MKALRTLIFWLHLLTGVTVGVVGQAIAGIVSLRPVFLVYTGLALTLRRFVKWTARRRPYGVDGAARRARVRA